MVTTLEALRLVKKKEYIVLTRIHVSISQFRNKLHRYSIIFRRSEKKQFLAIIDDHFFVARLAHKHVSLFMCRKEIIHTQATVL